MLLAAGAAWRWPSLHVANYLQFTSSRLSYSDVMVFHGNSIVQDHLFPYVKQTIEYPVLTGLILWVTGFAPHVEWYFAVNAILLSGCLFACFLLLARLRPRPTLARYALAPGLALYGVLNWDAPALLGLTGALYCFRSRRWALAGICLGVGASAKLFPAFVFPALLAYSLREPTTQGYSRLSASRPRTFRDAGAAVRLTGGFALTVLAINLPFALISWHGWSYWITFQNGRGVNLDSIWWRITLFSGATCRRLMDCLVAGGLVWIGIEVWRRRTWEAGSLLGILVFLLFTTDYSPQYDLWILPLLALLSCPLWIWIVFVAADFLYDLAAFHVQALLAVNQYGDSLNHAINLLDWSVWGREAALALIAIWAIMRMRGEQIAMRAGPIDP